MTLRNPFQDDVDYQGRKIENLADGTLRTDGVNLGQLQDVMPAVLDYDTQSNIPVLTNELTTETYVFRVQNNTTTALGEGSNLVINGSTIPAENRDIARGVGAGRFEYFTFTIPSNVLPNLQNNPNNTNVVITFGTGAAAVDVTVADEVSSHVGINYDLTAESSSVANSADIRLSGGDGSQDNVRLQGTGGTTIARTDNTITISAGAGEIQYIYFRLALSADGSIAEVLEPSTRLNQEIDPGETTFSDLPACQTHPTCLLYTSPSPRDS